MHSGSMEGNGHRTEEKTLTFLFGLVQMSSLCLHHNKSYYYKLVLFLPGAILQPDHFVSVFMNKGMNVDYFEAFH